MGQKEQIMATLLHNRECPVGYQCRSMDCIECLKIHMETKGAPNGAEKAAD